MQRGSIKWFNSTKGYGFIGPTNGDKDLFVHHSGLSPDLADLDLEAGTLVTFEVVDGRKGPQAENVQLDLESQTA